MPSKFLKRGNVVILTQGRYAGKKAAIVNPLSGLKEHGCDRILVAGIKKAPGKVHDGMSKKRIAKKIAIKPFVKAVNVVHVMPTRYKVDVSNLSSTVKMSNLKPQHKKKVIKATKETFETQFKNGKHKWFFTPLRF